MSVSRVMLIVGGTGSVGAAIANAALADGWRVVVHGRNADKLGTAAQGASDDALRTIAVDAFADGGAAQIVAQAADCFGRLDAVVDCITGGPAGITGFFRDTQPEAYAGLMEASVVHLQRLAHAAMPWLAKEGGTLIGFASDAGRFAAPGQTMIGTSRAAIMAFIRNFALEAARDGVRAHCISPSFIEGSAAMARAEQLSAKRMDRARTKAGLGLPTAEDIAPLVLFLCSDAAQKITGQVISINGGMNA